jgi:hypothetical protein
MAETAQAGMSMDDFDLFPDYNVPKYGKEGEDRWHGRFAVDDEEWNMVNLEAIGEVMNSGAPFVRVSDDNNFMASINELLFCNELWRIRRKEGTDG